MDERILEFIKNEQLLSWAMIDEKVFIQLVLFMLLMRRI